MAQASGSESGLPKSDKESGDSKSDGKSGVLESGSQTVQAMLLRHQFFNQKGMLDNEEIDTPFPLSTISHTPYSEYRAEFQRVLEKRPNQAIAIPPVPRREHVKHVGILRRVSKTKHMYKMPPFYTCWRIVNAFWVKHIITMLLLVNMGIDVALSMLEESDHPLAFDVLRNFEMGSNALFLFEIVMHMEARGPKLFFKDIWLVVDAVVMLLSFCTPGFVAIICASAGAELEVWMQRHRFLWWLGALKGFRIIPRISSLRGVVHSIFSVAWDFLNLGLMIFMVMYVFAVIGVYSFYDYTKAENPNLEFQYKFESLGQALVTMFQIITYDCWLKITLEVASEVSPALVYPYFIIWVWLGAFIFANIFTAILVNNSKEASEREEKRRRHREEVRQQVKEKNKYLQRHIKDKQKHNKFDGYLQVRGRDLANKVKDVFAKFEPFIPQDSGEEKDKPRNQKKTMADVPQDGGDDKDKSGNDKKKIAAEAPQDGGDKRNKHGNHKKEIVANLRSLGEDFQKEWPRDSYLEYFERLAELSDTLSYADELDKLMAQLVFQCLEGDVGAFSKGDDSQNDKNQP